MTMKYRADKHPVTGQIAILGREEQSLPFNRDTEFPLVTLSAQGGGFPLDTRQLAENVADLLGNFKPRHTLVADGQNIFYTPTETGIILKTRPAGEGQGVSTPAVTLTISDKSSVADYGHDVLARLDQDFMKRVCDTITVDPAARSGLERKDTGYKPVF